jgi:lipopolysaccharide/colanic/teichoic acid biosynthesis glycosyltransferase
MSKELQKNMLNRFYHFYGKRIFDLIISLVFSIVLLPLFIMIGLTILMNDGLPVLFKQYRLGVNFRKFKLYKFRTMLANSDQSGPLITRSGDPRITPIGKFLRKYKLDELPQFWNVIKGDMSLVGPRPEREDFVRLFESDYKSILIIKPGITDIASIKYRNEEELLRNFDDFEKAYIKEILPKKIQLDKKYIGNVSFCNDLKILFKTVWSIIS